MSSSHNHRERIQSTDAIVLRRLDLRETDRIFVILSEKFGKMSVIAKGIRRPNARFGSHLELFARTRLMLSRGRDLDVVSGAESIDMHVNLRSDLNAMATASHLTELAEQFLPEREENRASYLLLARSLNSLDTGAEPARVSRWFEYRLLSEMGLRPQLFECVVCGKPVVAEANAFNARLGGVLCADHAGQSLGTSTVSLAAQKVLRLLAREDLSSYLALTVGPDIENEVEVLLTSFVQLQLERDLRSLRVMRRVEESIPLWAESYKSTK
jgi:DNA repair protein RecO (recombination protein O)